VDILRDTRAAMEKEKLHQRMDAPDFASMTMVRKLKVVEKIFDEQLRPMLAADGGDVELVDLKEANGVWEIYIGYRGACMGCPSAGTNTLSAIETLLKQKLGENIRVVPS